MFEVLAGLEKPLLMGESSFDAHLPITTECAHECLHIRGFKESAEN
jgi:hypothetical protein